MSENKGVFGSHLPTRDTATGTANERQMIAKVGGQGGTRKELRSNTMLSTRLGMPTFFSVNSGSGDELNDNTDPDTGNPVPKEYAIVRHLSAIVITEKFPFGVQLATNDDGDYTIVNAEYAQPSYSFIDGRLDDTTWDQLRSPHNSPGLGANTWYDSRLDYSDTEPYAWSWHTLVGNRKNLISPKGYLRAYYSEGLHMYAYADAFAMMLPGQGDRDLGYVIPNASPMARVALNYAQTPTGETGDIVGAGEQLIGDTTYIDVFYASPNLARLPPIIDNLTFIRTGRDGGAPVTVEVPYHAVVVPNPRLLLAPQLSADGKHAAAMWQGAAFVFDTLTGTISTTGSFPMRGEKPGSKSVMTATFGDDVRNVTANGVFELWTNNIEAVGYNGNELQFIRHETYKKDTVADHQTYVEEPDVFEYSYKLYTYPGVGGSFDDRPGGAYSGGSTTVRHGSVVTEYGSKLYLEPTGTLLFQTGVSQTQVVTYSAETVARSHEMFVTGGMGYSELSGVDYDGLPPVGADYYGKDGTTEWGCYGYSWGVSRRRGYKNTVFRDKTDEYKSFQVISGVCVDFLGRLAIVVVENLESVAGRQRYEIEESSLANFVELDFPSTYCGNRVVIGAGDPPSTAVHTEGWAIPPEIIIRHVSQEIWAIDLDTGGRTALANEGSYFSNNTLINNRYEARELAEFAEAYTPLDDESRQDTYGDPQLNPQCHVSIAVSRDGLRAVVSIMQPKNAEYMKHPMEMMYPPYAKTDSLDKIHTKNLVLSRASKGSAWAQETLQMDNVPGLSKQVLFLSEIQLYDEVIEL